MKVVPPFFVSSPGSLAGRLVRLAVVAPVAILMHAPVFAAEAEAKAPVRRPLPSAEVIAKLPPDGGPDYNRLIFEKSPYLLQHAANPVDWYPWGDEAFAEAQRTGKPVFLSIGYTTCHWCHVMEHESFEDEEVARLINEHFIPVKVDREERPDIDEVYMTFTQALTGGGGWPMTVMLTAERKPFFAGTYFPKESRTGRPGMLDLVPHIAGIWKDQHEAVLADAARFAESLKGMTGGQPGDVPDQEVYARAYADFVKRYDAAHGGFGGAPKFPVPTNHLFLLRHWHRTGEAAAREMVDHTLHAMRRGGIYDHVGHGIHRYSTDPIWLLPHFEKMLYDQALHVMACVEAYQATGDERHARVAREVLGYVTRDMTHPDGGFYSAEDADSEGEEGKFYVWTQAELVEVLGADDADFYATAFNFAEPGNFKEEATGEPAGTNIPHLRADLSEADAARAETLRAKLFAAREKRIHPQKDDKILTDWNGLMIAAYARAAQALDDPAYAEAATRAADFVLSRLVTPDGRLLKRWREGEAGLTAHLEDYAFLVWGLLDLYETTFDLRYLREAVRLTDATLEHFWDEEGGGFFMTADDSEELLVRTKKLYGGAIPSGNAASVLNLARLHRMTGKAEYATRAETLLKTFGGELAKAPEAFPLTLCALELLHGPAREIVIVGEPDAPDTRALLAELRKPYLPNKVVLLRSAAHADELARLAPYTATQTALEGKATAYVCENFACQLPTADPAKVREMLKAK
ncbi:MAG: thioredoxin domain-containing protein [Verrucomicrobiales bacterium]|nr:thioredoxin domain-containing protein [Verrucomicrobiales bacterium]